MRVDRKGKVMRFHKGNQSWTFTGRTDAEAEAPILWSFDGKNWLIGKDTNAGKDWRQEEKGMTEDEMVWWHHWLNGHEFEQAPGVGDGEGSLVCCSPWALKGSDTTERLNWTVSGHNCNDDKLWGKIYLNLKSDFQNIQFVFMIRLVAYSSLF